MPSEVSHGRGGAGNITPDNTQYTDGEVVRAGVVGSHDDGTHSTGRGGTGNMVDAQSKSAVRKDEDIIPDAAVRASVENADYHTGRGGAGNAHLAHAHKTDGHTAPQGLADQLKDKLLGFVRNKK